MKIAKIVGLVAVAALALMASLGAGSALAVETALCKSGTDKPYCKSENLYPAKTALKASSSKVTVNFPFAVPIKVECSESTLEGETSAAAGKPMPLAISAWTLGGCKTSSGTGCTVTAVESAPYSGSLSWGTSWNGTLTIGDGGKGNPGWYFSCKKAMDCTITFAPVLDATGGSPATIVATNESLSNKSGGLCPPASSTFSGTYSVSSPNIAFITRAEAPPSPTTGLCKEVAAYCEQADQYPKGTTIKAESSNLTIEKASSFYGDLICKGASIAAETTAAYAEPLPIQVTSSLLSECKFNNGISCTMTATKLNSGSLSHISFTPNGKWNGAIATWLMQCSKSIECTVTMPSGPTMTLEGGSPAAIWVKKLNLEVSEGFACPTSATISADFTVTSPNPLYVTDMVR